MRTRFSNPGLLENRRFFKIKNSHNFSGEKKHQCWHCGKLFALKSYLNKHIEGACTAVKYSNEDQLR